MKVRPIFVATLGLILWGDPIIEAKAAVHSDILFAARQSSNFERAQWGPPHGAPDRRRGPVPRVYPGWRGEPGWRGAPAWRGPPGWTGRPYWFGRPWVRRPYYGTIIAGVALGTIITVAAVGLEPP